MMITVPKSSHVHHHIGCSPARHPSKEIGTIGFRKSKLRTCQASASQDSHATSVQASADFDSPQNQEAVNSHLVNKDPSTSSTTPQLRHRDRKGTSSGQQANRSQDSHQPRQVGVQPRLVRSSHQRCYPASSPALQAYDGLLDGSLNFSADEDVRAMVTQSIRARDEEWYARTKVSQEQLDPGQGCDTYDGTSSAEHPEQASQWIAASSAATDAYSRRGVQAAARHSQQSSDWRPSSSHPAAASAIQSRASLTITSQGLPWSGQAPTISSRDSTSYRQVYVRSTSALSSISKSGSASEEQGAARNERRQGGQGTEGRGATNATTPGDSVAASSDPTLGRKRGNVRGGNGAAIRRGSSSSGQGKAAPQSRLFKVIPNTTSPNSPQAPFPVGPPRGPGTSSSGRHGSPGPSPPPAAQSRSLHESHDVPEFLEITDLQSIVVQQQLEEAHGGGGGSEEVQLYSIDLAPVSPELEKAAANGVLIEYTTQKIVPGIMAPSRPRQLSPEPAGTGHTEQQPKGAGKSSWTGAAQGAAVAERGSVGKRPRKQVASGSFKVSGSQFGSTGGQEERQALGFQINAILGEYDLSFETRSKVCKALVSRQRYAELRQVAKLTAHLRLLQAIGTQFDIDWDTVLKERPHTIAAQPDSMLRLLNLLGRIYSPQQCSDMIRQQPSVLELTVEGLMDTIQAMVSGLELPVSYVLLILQVRPAFFKADMEDLALKWRFIKACAVQNKIWEAEVRHMQPAQIANILRYRAQTLYRLQYVMGGREQKCRAGQLTLNSMLTMSAKKFVKQFPQSGSQEWKRVAEQQVLGVAAESPEKQLDVGQGC